MSKLKFQIEALDASKLTGWVCDLEAPEKELVINVLYNGEIIASQTANLYRPHVKAAGFGNGKYGFIVDFPSEVWLKIMRRPSELKFDIKDDKGSIRILELPNSFKFDKEMGDLIGNLCHGTRIPNFFLTAVCIIKDESSYIEEWIDYHLLMGFQYFVIFNNGSQDNLLDVLSPYIKLGIARVIDWPNIHLMDPVKKSQTWFEQNLAYFYALRILRNVSEWVAFIDVDEFIVNASEKSLVNLLHSAKNQNVITLHWRNFGTSGHTDRPQGFVIQNFTKREQDIETSRGYKVIVRPNEVDRIINAHRFLMKGTSEVGQNYNGEKFFSSDEIRNNPTYSPLCIHHYHTRSLKEYEQKVTRGWPEKEKAANWNEKIKKIDVDPIEDIAITHMANQLAEYQYKKSENLTTRIDLKNIKTDSTDLVVSINLTATEKEIHVKGFAFNLAELNKYSEVLIYDITGKLIKETIAKYSFPAVRSLFLFREQVGLEFSIPTADIFGYTLYICIDGIIFAYDINPTAGE